MNGRPDHQKGQHDDLIMAMAMAIYVGESSFSKLEKATEQAKAMIESWTTEKRDFKDSSQNFNPGIPVDMYNRHAMGRYQATKNDYENYLWLFGKGKV
ncbi:MAG: hypothetical protein EBW87_04590 [Burkholderiaceae bacterium]|nr:hypothetical protein [Burkholderiaceae bacterium]